MMNVRTSTTRTPLTANHIRGFWAAWGGWALDGMDSFIYALVLTPALTELLPKSGIPPTPGNVGFYGSVLFALFLIGWGLSMVWGPNADRFGRRCRRPKHAIPIVGVLHRLQPRFAGRPNRQGLQQWGRRGLQQGPSQS